MKICDVLNEDQTGVVAKYQQMFQSLTIEQLRELYQFTLDQQKQLSQPKPQQNQAPQQKQQNP